MGATLADKIGVTEFNEILLGSKQAYVIGFDCEYILFNKDVNMFDRMEIAESIQEGVVEPSYQTPPVHMPTVLITAGIM